MNKTTKRSIELYRTLTPKQQAALFLELASNDDIDEGQRVMDSVELRTYTHKHAVFNDWRDYMGRAALLMASEYWRLNFLISTDVVRLFSDKQDSNQTQLDKLLSDDAIIEQMNQRQTTLNSMLRAFKQFSEDNGFSYEAMLKQGNISMAKKEDLNRYDETVFNDWLDVFNRVAPKYEPRQNIHNLPYGMNP